MVARHFHRVSIISEFLNWALDLRQELRCSVNFITKTNGTFNLHFCSLKLTPVYPLNRRKRIENKLKIMRAEK